MAKIKVRSNPDALSGLLKRKAMTQVDAAAATGVDRKTLTRIDRGEEVKLETLQKLANGLGVPISFFAPPATESEPPAAEWIEDEDYPFPVIQIMLRELETDALSSLLKKADRVHWLLKVQPVDKNVHKFLQEFEEAVLSFHRHLHHQSHEWETRGAYSLQTQLSGLQKREDVTALMKRLAEHRIAVLGADYLDWDLSSSEYEERYSAHVYRYTSTRILKLSIEQYGSRTRRMSVFTNGDLPPMFAPEDGDVVFVNGVQLTKKQQSEANSEGVKEGGSERGSKS